MIAVVRLEDAGRDVNTERIEEGKMRFTIVLVLRVEPEFLMPARPRQDQCVGLGVSGECIRAGVERAGEYAGICRADDE